MIHLFPSFEVVLVVLLLGTFSVFAIVLLCSKSSKKVSFHVIQPTNDKESNVRLAPDAPLEDVHCDAPNMEEDENGERTNQNNFRDSQRKQDNEIFATENERPYAEINLGCKSDKTYSTIQEADNARSDLVQGISKYQLSDDFYSVIDNNPDVEESVPLPENPYSCLEFQPEPPLTPRPRETEDCVVNFQESNVTPISDCGSQNFAHLYSKVMRTNKQSNDSSDEHNITNNISSLKDLVDTTLTNHGMFQKSSTSNCSHPIKGRNIYRNSVVGIMSGPVDHSNNSLECLYSRVNKRNTFVVFEGHNFTKEITISNGISQKCNESDDGQIYSSVTDVNLSNTVDITGEHFQYDKENQIYEEIND